MGFVKPYVDKLRFIWLFLSRTLNRSALAHRRQAGQAGVNQSTVIFVASVRDFQLISKRQFAPDKLEFWRQEVKTLGLSSRLIVMPFSEMQNKNVPGDAHFIEPFALPPDFTGIGLRAIFDLVTNKISREGLCSTPRSIQITKQLWKNFLLYTKPKVVIGVGLTDAILETCREQGIKTIEFQHGVFSTSELKRWWKELSEGGNNVPDLFVTWDEHYSKVATKLGISSVTLGYPFDFTKSVQSNMISQDPMSSLKKRIIVTLSCRETTGIDPWGMIDEDIDFAILELLRSGCEVRLRIHPMAEKGLIRRFKVSKWLSRRYQGAALIFPSDESILESLRSVDIHLTVSSSTILEASYLGIPSLFFSRECLPWFPSELIGLRMMTLTSKMSILEDVKELSNLSINQYRNPLSTQLFRQVLSNWSVN
jgi:hypothetical protein